MYPNRRVESSGYEQSTRSIIRTVLPCLAITSAIRKKSSNVRVNNCKHSSLNGINLILKVIE